MLDLFFFFFFFFFSVIALGNATWSLTLYSTCFMLFFFGKPFSLFRSPPEKTELTLRSFVNSLLKKAHNHPWQLYSATRCPHLLTIKESCAKDVPSAWFRENGFEQSPVTFLFFYKFTKVRWLLPDVSSNRHQQISSLRLDPIYVSICKPSPQETRGIT